MSNAFFNADGAPATGSSGSSAVMRAEFAAIAAGFAEVPAALANATTTGTGAVVLANSPTLVTPILGTPSSITLTHATGLPIATGVAGLGAGVATALAAGVSGTGNVVLVTSPTLVTPNLGTPASATLTNATGLPVATGLAGAGAGVVAALAAATTGTGGIVLATSPTLVTPALGTPSAVVLTHGTALPVSTGLTGVGTGVLTALGLAVTGTGSIVLGNSPTLVTPALGTPSAAVLTSATGLPVSTGLAGAGTGVVAALGNPVNATGGFALFGGGATLSNLSAAGSVVSMVTMGTFYDGCSVAQGTSGTWLVIGTIEVQSGTPSDVLEVNVSDGSTIITTSATEGGTLGSVTLPGIIINPVGNLRISAKNRSSNGGTIDGSNIVAVRIG